MFSRWTSSASFALRVARGYVERKYIASATPSRCPVVLFFDSAPPVLRPGGHNAPPPDAQASAGNPETKGVRATHRLGPARVRRATLASLHGNAHCARSFSIFPHGSDNMPCSGHSRISFRGANGNRTDNANPFVPGSAGASESRCRTPHSSSGRRDTPDVRQANLPGIVDNSAPGPEHQTPGTSLRNPLRKIAGFLLQNQKRFRYNVQLSRHGSILSF